MHINKLIDHTFLKAEGTKKDIDKILEEAITYDFKSVCLQPCWVEYAVESLKKTDVLVCTTIGFPLGANTTETKVYETVDALKKGAHEIDMVLNVGWVKDGLYDKVEAEIKAVKDACQNNTLKVILETCYLTKSEIEKASEAAISAGADFIKTSTGFGSGGATKEDVALMKKIAKDKGVKASGGVRSLEDLKTMVEAGATRIGASSGVKIMQGKISDEKY